jgi:LmbE family N-acetylglucosaminyl deacetylase
VSARPGRAPALPRGSRTALLLALCLIAPGAFAQTAPAADDSYSFAAGAGEQSSVPLTGQDQALTWSWAQPAAADWDTVLVGVRVASTSDPQPFVEMAAGGHSLRQYLEPEAHGLRWLNLSGLRPELTKGTSVSLALHGLRLEPGPATLRVFANRLDLKGAILILAPHPDDAEIAAFGLYASHPNVTIVTVTCGNAGDANYAPNFSDPARQYRFKGYLRAVDSVTVPWQGGVPPERCYNMGYFDARLATMRERPAEVVSEMYGPNQDVSPYRRANLSQLLPNGPRTSTWDHLVEDLVEVLKKVRPALVVTPHPDLDTHPDHEFVTVALVDALERYKQPLRFLLYTNHAYKGIYPFGPAGTVMSLPPWSGRALTLQGVFSYPVSAELQRRKLFALESMHDLRLSPTEQEACGDPNAPRRPDYPRVPAVDYFRRGPRSDELFYVFDRQGLTDLVRSFLAQRRQSDE